MLFFFVFGNLKCGSIFQKKSSGLRKALQKLNYELIYVDGPIILKTADLPFQVSDVSSLGGQSVQDDNPNYRSWWPADETKPDYYSLETSLLIINEAVEKQGPFEGVIGFSQGAGFAGLLCEYITNIQHSKPFYARGSNDESQKILIKQDPFKFAIFYSGFRAKAEFLQFMYDKKIDTPTLHVLGSLDTVVSEERSLLLWDSCEESSRTMLRHPGGHFVPNSKGQITTLLGWLQDVNDTPTEDPNLKESEPGNDDEWAMFDKIGKL